MSNSSYSSLQDAHQIEFLILQNVKTFFFLKEKEKKKNKSIPVKTVNIRYKIKMNILMSNCKVKWQIQFDIYQFPF